MAVPSPTELLASLQEHGFLTLSQVQELGAGSATKFADSRALTRELVDRNWLTAFQANLLLQGMGRDLRLGPYRLQDRLGQGGMGEVFKAYHVNMDRVVALKIIPKDQVSNPVAVARFYREVRAVAKLSHPNIVIAFDVSQVGETHFLVMEYVAGIDLANLVAQSGPLAITQACDYIRQAATGLQHAHEKGLVHRDIKPGNLIVARPSPDQAPVIKILDFGLARIERETTHSRRLTQLGNILGTVDYMAPEQAENARTADIRADIYSLGCSLFYLLTAQPPFPGEAGADKLSARVMDRPQSIRSLRPEVPDRLEQTLAKMLARDPTKRFQTPAEVAGTLAPFCKPGKVAAGSSNSVSHQIAAGNEGSEKVVAGTKERTRPAAANPFASLAAEGITSSKRSPSSLGGGKARAKAAENNRLKLSLAIGCIAAAVLGLVLVIVLSRSGRDGKDAYGPIVKYGDSDTRNEKDQNTARDNPPDTVKNNNQEGGATRIDKPPQERVPKIVPTDPDAKKEESPPIVATEGFVPLFNGKDLTGWRPHPYWAVQNGIITASIQNPSRLVTRRDDWKDFHLRVEARVQRAASETRCGRITFRAPREDQGYYLTLDRPPGKITLTSQIQTGTKIRSGLMAPAILLPPGEWINLDVIARGNSVKIFVNGKPGIDALGSNNAPASGAIGLGGGKDICEFRKIEIKELSAGVAQVVKPTLKDDLAALEGEWVTVDLKDGDFKFKFTPAKNGIVSGLANLERKPKGLGPTTTANFNFRLIEQGPTRTILWPGPGGTDSSLNYRFEQGKLFLHGTLILTGRPGDGGLRRLSCDFQNVELQRSTPEVRNTKPADDAWLRQVAAMPAEKQVEVVVAKLKERNPGFDGKVTHKVEGGVVTGLSFRTDMVTDISPVRALTGLRRLGCSCSPGKGQLADLSPLMGMRLETLAFGGANVSDLSPLKGIPLKYLYFDDTKVSDLSPLKGMGLTILQCGNTEVSDLAPLKDMEELIALQCANTAVSDLAPLKGMPLKLLHFNGTKVSDLSSLKGMALTTLSCQNTGVSDLSVLKGMPLQRLRCDFNAKRDADVLRSIKTLESINGKRADEFWKEVDAKSNLPPDAAPKGLVKKPSGLKYVELKVGTGKEAKVGNKVTVHYTGWLKDVKKFDSSVDRKAPFTFALGQGRVIKGWDEGVVGMKVGGKRKLIIQTELAYRSKGIRTIQNGVEKFIIPPNSELHYEIVLLKVE